MFGEGCVVKNFRSPFYIITTSTTTVYTVSKCAVAACKACHAHASVAGTAFAVPGHYHKN
jgi:hypothetical protein